MLDLLKLVSLSCEKESTYNLLNSIELIIINLSLVSKFIINYRILEGNYEFLSYLSSANEAG